MSNRINIFKQHGFNDTASLIENQRAVLKINKIYTNVGVKTISRRQSYNDETFFFKELTVCFRPGITGTGYNTQESAGIRNKLREIYKECKGFATEAFEYRYKVIPKTEKIEDVMLGDIKIGVYYKTRNAIVIYCNPFMWYWEPEFLKDSTANGHLKFHEDIAEAISKLNIRIVNVENNSKKIMMQNFQKSITKRIIELENHTRDQHKYVTQYEKGFVEAAQKIQENKVMIETLSKQTGQLARLFNKELRAIQKLQFVKNVKLEVGYLKIDVGKVSITGNIDGETKMVYLGDYIIYITPNKISFENKDQLENTSKQHPHIASGEPCFGGGRSSMLKLLAEMKFSNLVLQLYAYLKRYNGGDSYISLKRYAEYRIAENKFNEKGERLSLIRKAVGGIKNVRN